MRESDVMKSLSERPSIVVTTDVNGTTTPDNTFGELVRADGLFPQMNDLMQSYTSGKSTFAEVLPKMEELAHGVDRSRLETYAHKMPLFAGVTSTFDALTQSETVRAKVALSTTGFAGLMALVNRFRHRFLLNVAASPVLLHLLSEEETSCLIRPITSEEEKIAVIQDLVGRHPPTGPLLFHVGDTMGDFPGIRHVAEQGGIGVAFNPNKALKARIRALPKAVRERISEIDFVAGEGPNYARVGDIIRETLWEVARTEL